MIDLADLRKNPDKYQRACDLKRITFDVHGFVELDSRRNALRAEAESLRARQNSLSKDVPKLQGEEQARMRAELKELSVAVKEANRELGEIESEWERKQLLLPSIPSEKVPHGKDDTENVELYTNGTIPTFNFEIKDHIALGKLHGLIEVERGVKIAGARNYFLTGDGARLHHAVLQCAMDFLNARGYRLMDPPHIVNYEAMLGTGYFPGGEEMAYHLDERDAQQYLIGTSEVPVAAFHSDEVLREEELPKRYCGYSPCYRREAGSYGKDTHGLYRVHQFFKVEQVVICRADEQMSADFHAELLRNAEEFMQSLELPYRVVAVCSGDLGQGQVYKNDIETWMPSRQMYSETHSCSTLHDFQARRLKLRYKGEDGKNRYCHTLNNTLVASPRILIPLLELNQRADGTIAIPEALQPYMRGQKQIG
ncbi:MAG: serine--tRNA ligase [Bdellovibrionales bacterium]|nr:serine--tRNA ligase [Bdellovibrionales bacterium]